MSSSTPRTHTLSASPIVNRRLWKVARVIHWPKDGQRILAVRVVEASTDIVIADYFILPNELHRTPALQRAREAVRYHNQYIREVIARGQRTQLANQRRREHEKAASAQSAK